MHNFFLHKNILIFRRFFNSANRYRIRKYGMDDTIKILLIRLIKLNQEDFYISPASGFLPMLVSKVMMSYRFNAL